MEVVEKLYNTGIIDEDLEEKLLNTVGLRNIIVHMYADLRPELLYNNL
ncbi:MAG: HepT-like ribonuclease domain-containing protein [Nitrososphaeria archaeon]